MNLSRAKELTTKSIYTLKKEGITSFTKKGYHFIAYKMDDYQKKQKKYVKDILFINGCGLPHPQRYRVDHQIEQLESHGIYCDKIHYERLTLDQIKYYRGFVFYRCPITPNIEKFIKIARENNKTCFYDIDDLVFDLKYTDGIKYLDTLSEEERKLYDDGVVRMGATLKLCEYGISSTERLQTEMKYYLKDVYVNRNVASDEMIKYSERALVNIQKDNSKIIMGYLSGSITHNDDFKIIMPTIIKLLKEYKNVYFMMVGLLDLPQEMEEVKDKVLTNPFVDWKELPSLIRSIDINLAPLEDNIFNEAKSENKWMEAGLVKIPTVASNVGAFQHEIIHQKTGMLCNKPEEWEISLKTLIEDCKIRNQIGDNAYQEIMERHTTIKSGLGIAEFIQSKLRKNINFVVPSTNISGGIMVVMKHGFLLKKHGYDVTLINIDTGTRKIDELKEQDESLFVISNYKTQFLGYIDTMVATMWITLSFVQKHFNSKYKKYLVQGMETNFYKYGEKERQNANATYCYSNNIDYLTISKWCQKWLKEDFKVNAKYVSNGIDLSIFPYKKRSFKGKIKILIEGNCNDFYKNVDESFQITNKLDKNKYEIHYLSYEKEPKDWYQFDNFYHKIPHEKVGEIYQNCDILIKTSILDSFSYPPLEMMATGGFVIALQNDGNQEYLKHRYNGLIYEQGNIEEAISLIEELVSDKSLRVELEKNGLKTAEEHDWEKLEPKIIKLYE